MIQCTMSKLQY